MDSEYLLDPHMWPRPERLSEVPYDRLTLLSAQMDQAAVGCKALVEHWTRLYHNTLRAAADIKGELAIRRISVPTPCIDEPDAATDRTGAEIETPETGTASREDRTILEGRLAGKGSLASAVRTEIVRQLEACAGNRTQAARALGLSKRQMGRIIAQMRGEGIAVPESSWTPDLRRKLKAVK
jgi:DNA-binding NtrC family response regulator